MPAGAGFCPNCGTPTGVIKPAAPPEPDPATILPTGVPAPAHAETIQTPPSTRAREIAEAATIGPTGVVTSLDNPSPRAVRHGDGPFQPGQQIGPRYTILKLLGTGGMGAVYQAFDHELGVAVAIKVIRPSAQSDATAAKELELRFKRELVLARQVTHKHVVRIHDLGEIDGTKYLTMPFIEGETLAQIIGRTGKLPLDRVIKIAQQVAQGLAAAHEKGVVHRDLKPENIMIEKAVDEPIPNRGDALIMDFGIARSVESGATQTVAGAVIGTLEYMAPEQAQGKKVDQRCDQYSFGLIVYDMLVGRQRLQNRDNAMTELLGRIAAPPPSPRSINPDVPEPLDQIVMRLLEPSPDKRFATTQELVTALGHLTPDGQIGPDTAAVQAIGRMSRLKWQIAAAAFAMIAIGAGAGWFASKGTLTPTVEASRDPINVLIGDFENKTGDSVFDGVVEQALSLGIEGASFINSFPRRDAVRAANAIKPGAKLDEQTALLVAIRENLGMVIVGGIEPKGAGYHISIKGIAPGSNNEVKYTLEDDADSKAAVLATVGELAGQVRKAMGDTVAPAPNEAFTAASIEAAREYARAQELRSNGRSEEALAAYQDAIKLDPEFGRAYAGAATVALNLNRRDEAEKYFQGALARIDRMTEREVLRTRGQHYFSARNGPKAIEEFTTLINRYPADSTGVGNLAISHFSMRQFDKAMEIATRAVKLNPKNVVQHNNIAMYAMYAGKFDDAIARAKQASALNNTYPLAWLAQGLSAAALGKYDDATAAYRTLAGLPGWKATATQGIADIAMLRGRIADAAAALEPLLSDKLAPQHIARAQTTLASIRLAQGRTAEAIKLAEAAATAHDAFPRVEAARVLVAADRVAPAKQIAAELNKSVTPEMQALGLALAGEIQLASGDARAAIQTFRQSLNLADAWHTRYLLGRAYLEAEAYTEADSEFDACLRRQGEATAVYLDDVPTWRSIAPVYYYQGVTRAALKRASATESFKTFLGFKSGGDEQSPLVADARKRLTQ